MNKDAIVATGIGFGVGLVITGLVLYGPTMVKSMKFPSLSFSLPKFSFSLPTFGKSTPTPAPQTNTNAKKDHTLTIESPIADALETEETMLVSGSTTPGATTIIASTLDEVVVVANDKGTYAGKVTLAEGKNTILVTSMEPKGPTLEQTVTVYYTPEAL